ncbi:hypothetical protein AURANDRAFT_69071, partial [Aureococcus anophagefferens]
MEGAARTLACLAAVVPPAEWASVHFQNGSVVGVTLVAALPQEVVELRRGSEPSRGVEVPPPPPIVPPGHSVLEVSLALTNGSYGIRIGLDSASRVVITDFTEHEVMAAGALRVGDVVLSVHGFDASRASFDEVVEKFGDAKSADAMVVLG